MKKLSALLLTSILFVSLTACDIKPSGNDTDVKKLKIVTTIFPVYDFTRAVIGDVDSIDLSMLIKPGASVHSYDPSISDIRRINESDVFICIGGEMEEWAERLLTAGDLEGKTVIRLIEYVDILKEAGITESDSCGHDHSESNAHIYDGHIWTSPANAIIMVEVIAKALAMVDSIDDTELYERNAAEYINNIELIIAEIHDIIVTAGRNKIIIADRNPFLYFLNEFAFEYEAAFGACSDQSDASIATIIRLTEIVKNDRIPYVYYVELSSGNVAEVIAEETGCGTLLLHSCQNVTDIEFRSGATYLSLMKQNAENLRRGLS
ncbi:MAG: metal ABC transporter substrate-binding protein [Oscillospiraceae bacterium]|nr:metal ABC transporter substrate-binding protein [Oscillospiraceae bacterium]